MRGRRTVCTRGSAVSRWSGPAPSAPVGLSRGLEVRATDPKPGAPAFPAQHRDCLAGAAGTRTAGRRRPRAHQLPLRPGGRGGGSRLRPGEWPGPARCQGTAARTGRRGPWSRRADREFQLKPGAEQHPGALPIRSACSSATFQPAAPHPFPVGDAAPNSRSAVD